MDGRPKDGLPATPRLTALSFLAVLPVPPASACYQAYTIDVHLSQHPIEVAPFRGRSLILCALRNSSVYCLACLASVFSLSFSASVPHRLQSSGALMACR
jgi:hypothetical protein